MIVYKSGNLLDDNADILVNTFISTHNRIR